MSGFRTCGSCCVRSQIIIMADCIFCKILSGEIPANILYQDELCFVINDIHPKADHHVLIIPKTHIPTLTDSEDEVLFGRMMSIGRSEMVKKEVTGYKLQMNVHEKGGQEVMHIHLHAMGWM